jgi:hypothetical protein
MKDMPTNFNNKMLAKVVIALLLISQVYNQDVVSANGCLPANERCNQCGADKVTCLSCKGLRTNADCSDKTTIDSSIAFWAAGTGALPWCANFYTYFDGVSKCIGRKHTAAAPVIANCLIYILTVDGAPNTC